MVKAQFILKCLISSRRLRSICALLNVPYKYVYAVTFGNENPSSNIQIGLGPIIFPSAWNEEADLEFQQMYKQQMKQTTAHNLLDNV